MGKSISKVLNDTEMRKSMTEKGFVHASKFDEVNIANNLMRVYRNL